MEGWVGTHWLIHNSAPPRSPHAEIHFEKSFPHPTMNLLGSFSSRKAKRLCMVTCRLIPPRVNRSTQSHVLRYHSVPAHLIYWGNRVVMLYLEWYYSNKAQGFVEQVPINFTGMFCKDKPFFICLGGWSIKWPFCEDNSLFTSVTIFMRWSMKVVWWAENVNRLRFSTDNSGLLN